jgi:RNA polymerase sigma-70 factor, ECF subfamily
MCQAGCIMRNTERGNCVLPVNVNLTQSLARWNSGDRSVEPELMAALYPLLRSIAQKQLRDVGHVTMQATEFANEAFIRIRQTGIGDTTVQKDFMGFVARVLRNLIVDHLRLRNTNRRGGAQARVGIAELDHMSVDSEIENHLDWLELDRALEKLEEEDPKHARLVELRYFLGYSNEDAAAQLDVSVRTANRMWRFARAFLHQEMQKQALDQRLNYAAR